MSVRYWQKNKKKKPAILDGLIAIQTEMLGVVPDLTRQNHTSGSMLGLRCYFSYFFFFLVLE